MSEKGAGLDNAVAERFFGSLKGERLVPGRYATRQETRADVVEYSAMLSHSTRWHASLGYTSPHASEAGEKGA
jgi:putative transposase